MFWVLALTAVMLSCRLVTVLAANVSDELAGPLRALHPAQTAETGPHPGPPILVWPAPTCCPVPP